MAEVEVVPSILDLDWFGDLTLYQHPPCMFILWYLALGGKVAYELIDKLMKSEGGDGGDGGGAKKDEGGEEGGEKPAEGGEQPAGEGGEKPAEGGEEAPPPAEEEPPPPEEAS